jgi:RHS repeat-associated protein
VQFYSHPDWLGSARTISSAARTWVGSQAYAPFGEKYAASGSSQSLFTNQYNDEAGDLYDFPAREQHRVQGRWISPDPAGLAAADPSNPQSWNRYAYTLNGPTYMIDPLGLQGVKLLQEPSGGNPAWVVFAQGGYSGFFGDGGGYGAINPPPGDWRGTSFDWYLACAGPNSIPYGCYGGAATALDANGGSGGSAANNGFTLGVRAPGQSFNDCMKANAGNYSLLGVADFALDANGKIADNFWLGFTPASNTVTNVYNAATGSLTSLAQTGPMTVQAGMGTTITYGRRTSSVMSLNLPGTPGGPKGGFPALGSAPSNAARAAAKAASYLKLAVDAGFFLAEAVGCSIPMNP